MALKGLEFTTWVGWLWGILLVKRPWGAPSFTSWFSFSSLIAAFTLGMYIFIMVDISVNNSGGLFLDDTNVFGRWVRFFTVTSWIGVTFMKRLSFIMLAKKLGKVMNVISDYGGVKNKKKNHCGLCSFSYECVIINFSFILTFASTFVRAYTFLSSNATQPSWFNVLGVWGYAIIYYTFAIFPLSFTSTIAYAIILVTSLRVADMFCDFCTEVRKLLPHFIYEKSDNGYDDGRHHPVEIFNILQKSQKFSYFRGHKISPLTTSPAEIISKSAELSKTDVLEQFEDIKEFMKLTNDALSPLLLWQVTGLTLGLVTTASQMFVTEADSVNFVADVLFMITIMIFGTLLQMGHKIVERQGKVKLALQREFLNMPWTPGKLEMEDVVQEILDWEWKLSAAGFFGLDRRLASGIFSLVLNYVVIFVQLNIALTETPPATCSNNNASIASIAHH